MATPFLAINYRDGGTPKAKRYANCSPSDPVAPGVSFGTLDTVAYNHNCNDNRIVQFGGERTFLALTRDAVYRTTDGGLSWASVKALTTPSTTLAASRSGLWVVDLGGVPTVCCFYYVSGNSWRALSSVDGTTWIDYGPFLPGTTQSTSYGCVSQVVYNNTIYGFFTSNAAAAGNIVSFSPGAGSMASISVQVLANSCWSFAPWRNSLYFIYKPTSGGVVGLYDITTGTLVLTTTFSGGATVSPTTGARYADGFVDPATGDLIVCYYETTALGWRIYRVSPTFVPLEITNSVRPIGLSGTTVGGNSPTTSRIRVLVDQESSPGGTPGIYLFYSADGASGTPMTMYRWQGVATTMTVEDAGGNTADSLGICYDNDGGSYSWSAGEKHIRVLSWVPAPGGIRITFTLWSASGTDPVKVRAYTRRDTLQSRCATPAEVLNPSAGALSGTGPGNFNTGLTANNGATTYLLTVNLFGNGFALAERGRVILDAVDP